MVKYYIYSKTLKKRPSEMGSETKDVSLWIFWVMGSMGTARCVICFKAFKFNLSSKYSIKQNSSTQFQQQQM